MSVNENQLYIEDFQNVLSRAKGTQVKVICPICNDRRTNKADRSLSINTQTLEYKCHYCHSSGVLKSKNEESSIINNRYFKIDKKEYIKPKPKKENSDKYADSFLEYFKSRGISEQTLIEARVTQETEYFPHLNAKAGCMGFNYYLKGELVNVKYRPRQKGFKLVSGARLIPYNIDSISLDKFKEDEEKYVIWTEGEFDTLTYIECGFKHVVSVPNGASNNTSYIDDFIEEYFDKLDVIYISVDNDNNGMILRKELIRRFGEERCRIIDYPKPCKDINEVLVQYGKDEVVKCFKNYTELKPDGVKELVDVETNLDYLFYHGFEPGAKIGVPSFDKIISFKVGMLCVVTGVPSHGKTFALNFILSKLNLIHDWKIAFFSPEFYPIYEHMGQILETLGGKRFESSNYNVQEYETMKDYVCRNFFWLDPDDTDVTSVMERAKYLVKKKGIKALVIDPFNALTDKNKPNVRQDEYISDFLQQLRWFARKYAVAVFLVMHPTKMTKNDNGLYPICDLYNCKGASEVFDKADIGLTAWRNEFDNYNEIHVTKVKFRHLGEKGHATFKFNVNNGRYVEIEDVETLKKQGIVISTIQVNWDNSNWIVDKINGSHVQQTIQYATEQPKGFYGSENSFLRQQEMMNPGGFLDSDGSEAPF